uniref:Uncharacterized protein n=1 Tax=Pristhesancus plagipennis TaxID=1955184 RepID=A0A2K8JLW3_PRIPG|nr:secreted hypothetical protein [Pristhesancus plagipennis]
MCIFLMYKLLLFIFYVKSTRGPVRYGPLTNLAEIFVLTIWPENRIIGPKPLLNFFNEEKLKSL